MSLPNSVETSVGQDYDSDNESENEQVYFNINNIVIPKRTEADDNPRPRPTPPPRRHNSARSEQLATLSPPTTENIPHRVSVSPQQSSPLEEGFNNRESDEIPTPKQVTVGVEDAYVSFQIDGVQDGVQEELNDCLWYWGDISRSDAEQMLKNNTDGSFLVRDSTTPGDYTLTVRKDGQSKCLKLYQNDGRFGLKVNECTFKCLSNLIDYYTQHSLAEFNRRLDTKLNSYPPKTRGKRSENCYESLSKLAAIGRQLQQTKQQYIALQEEKAQCNELLEDSQLQERALETARSLFSQLLEPSLRDVDEEDMPLEKKEILDQNKKLVTERLKAIEDKISFAQQETGRFENEFYNITMAINNQVEVLRDAEENCNMVVKQVIEEGAKKELVECLVEEGNTEAPDRSLWFVDCTRDKANDLLKHEPTGTFLFRPKDGSDNYALSIVSGNEDGKTTVKHCVIHNPPGRGYGFSADGAVFESIEELVCKHSKTSIKVYFSHMDTCLDHPIFGKRPRSSGEIEAVEFT